MAFSQHQNIKGASGRIQTLVKAGDIRKNIQTIVLCNVHASDDASVDLSVRNLTTGNEIYYLIKNMAIPAKSTLVLDNKNLLSYDTINNSLVITVAATDTVDVTIIK